MEKDILDYIENENPPEWKKYAYLLPYVLYCIGLLFSAVDGFFSEFQYLLGLALVVITGLTYSFNRRLGMILNGIVIIFGVVNLVNFFPFEVSIGGKFGTVFVGLDLMSAVVAGLFLYINMEEFRPQFHNLIYGPPELQASVAVSRVEKFKEKYKGRSIAELNRIAHNTSMVEEARQAASELLEGSDSHDG